jgi:hypothetical protein
MDRVAIAELAEVVFTGMARAYGEEDRVAGHIAVEFQVANVYKGPVAPRMLVQALGGRGPSELGIACGWGFKLGRQYTVFALDYDTDGVPNTNGCLWPVDGPISAALYSLPAGSAPEGDGEARELALVAAVALATLGIFSVVRRPRPLSP